MGKLSANTNNQVYQTVRMHVSAHISFKHRNKQGTEYVWDTSIKNANTVDTVMSNVWFSSLHNQKLMHRCRKMVWCKNVFTTHAQRELIVCEDAIVVELTERGPLICQQRTSDWGIFSFTGTYLCFYTVITIHTEELRGLVELQRPFLNWCQEMSSCGTTGRHIWIKHPLQLGRYDSRTMWNTRLLFDLCGPPNPTAFQFFCWPSAV